MGELVNHYIFKIFIHNRLVDFLLLPYDNGLTMKIENWLQRDRLHDGVLMI